MSEYEKLLRKYQFWKDFSFYTSVAVVVELVIITIMAVFFKGVL